MRILFLGDVVGEPGRKLLLRGLPGLRAERNVDLVVANAENAADGSGINPRCFQQLMAAGVNACTMGDHVYRRKEIYPLFEQGKPICRPANLPDASAGPSYLLLPMAGEITVAVFSLLGRLFMKPVDCPFRAADRTLEELRGKAKIILVDMHAEATSEKQAMLHHLRGRVSAIFGTHTHVPTADAAIYEPGTAYITDVGMTGPYESIIGRQVAPVLYAALTFQYRPFEVAKGDPRLSGALVDVDAGTGQAIAIELIHRKVPPLPDSQPRQAKKE